MLLYKQLLLYCDVSRLLAYQPALATLSAPIKGAGQQVQCRHFLWLNGRGECRNCPLLSQQPTDSTHHMPGLPSFLKHVPVLGHALRGVTVRAVQRMLEDIQTAINKVEAGQRWEDVVKPAPSA